MNNIGITKLIDQSKFSLIGHQVYYADGSNFFNESLDDKLESKQLSNPIVRVEQVGKVKDGNKHVGCKFYSHRKITK